MSTTSLPNTKSSKGLHIVLWILQVALAGMFIMAGFMKLTTPVEQLGTQMAWVKDVSAGLVRFIGASELLGGLGLVLPSLLRIKPWLTPLAAIGLALIMFLAAIFHISRGETGALGINFILAALAIFIAWGRSKKAPIHTRNLQA
ncbi:hypothetical protein AHMF7605_22960 [Adhaeribacter arboris]|uniref:DoxX family protein n=1 Tax=Adhaeribacter arboris TaxID=2072846 RepID=A0A2T2YKZ1_9BACT|nr:DoxX family protein [Adhaeribacter arboris]PSR56159.1 hypothetical protein AHMF7605_22960 [Adhaeribacter arboris]